MPGKTGKPLEHLNLGDERVFRESRASDDSALRKIFQEANLALRFNHSEPAAAFDVGSLHLHVCEIRGEVVGAVQWQHLGTEAEILDVVVDAGFRRQGNGGYLLERLLRINRERGVRDVFLEVRESNLAAIMLYQKFGFSAFGRRPNYYRHPNEAALLLRTQIAG
jgi:ribosomal-protein-alanine acetyltransferase